MNFLCDQLICKGCCAMLSHSVMSDSLRPHGLYPTSLLCSRGFSRQEHWSGLPCPPPGHLPNSGIEPRVSHTVDAFSTIWATREAPEYWSGSTIPSPGEFPDPGIKPGSPASQVNSLPSELPRKPNYCSHSYEKSGWNLTLNSNSQNLHLYIVGSLFRGKGKIARWEKMKFN